MRSHIADCSRCKMLGCNCPRQGNRRPGVVRASCSFSIETFIGSIFDDRIQASSTAHVLRRHSGNDSLTSERFNDELHRNSGDDALRSGAGDDRLFGGSGDDFLNGGRGQDFLVGGAGDDRASGLFCNDIISGGDGDDWLHGHKNDDQIDGDSGVNRLIGGGGDELEGGQGMDRLFGGTGDDVLAGGAGNDILRGGIGADVFKMAGDFGTEKILVFEIGYDEIHFDSAGFGSLEVLFHEQIGANLQITSKDSAVFVSTVVLVGVELSNFSMDDLQF